MWSLYWEGAGPRARLLALATSARTTKWPRYDLFTTPITNTFYISSVSNAIHTHAHTHTSDLFLFQTPPNWKDECDLHSPQLSERNPDGIWDSVAVEIFGSPFFFRTDNIIFFPFVSYQVNKHLTEKLFCSWDECNWICWFNLGNPEIHRIFSW